MNASNLVNAYAQEITALCQGIERAKALRSRFAHLGLDKGALTDEDCAGIGVTPSALLATMAALDGFDLQMSTLDKDTGRTGYGLLYLLYQGR